MSQATEWFSWADCNKAKGEFSCSKESSNIVISTTQVAAEPRIIGWGIRFKLQMLCPQVDE